MNYNTQKKVLEKTNHLFDVCRTSHMCMLAHAHIYYQFLSRMAETYPYREIYTSRLFRFLGNDLYMQASA